MDTTKHSVDSLLEIFSAELGRSLAGFDRIILDPPCSGFGKRPDLLPEFPKAEYFLMQRKLLMTAWSLLRPNGVIVYSTCSVLPQENEKVIEYLLSKVSDAEIEALKYSQYGTPGIEFNGISALKHCRRFLPPSIDTVGFFIAKLRKIQTKEISC
jgi:16S rRNA (cytosine967-C5)-methyltransferase